MPVMSSRKPDRRVALEPLPAAIDVEFIVRSASKRPLAQVALDDRSKVGRSKRLLEVFLGRLRKKTTRFLSERASRHEDHSIRLLRCHQ